MATPSGNLDGPQLSSGHDSTPAMTIATGNLRIQLQALLDDKEKQLRLAGTLGQRVLAQQVELEERITQLNDLEEAKTSADDEVETEIRKKLQELKDTMDSWESENQEMFGGLVNKINGAPPSPPITPHPSQEPEDPSVDPSVVVSPTSGPSAAQSSRRAKNAAHRANDVEFAFEIGSSLLTEVRRLQSLLGERDKAIQDMKEEKDDLDKLVENLRAGLRTQEASADKYKEENWNMEVMMQELRGQLSDAQAAVQNAENERKRTAKQLVSATDAAEQHKTEAERLTNSLTEFKAKHETDVAQMRKQAAGLQRDKSDLQSTLEALKTEIAKKERSIKRFGSPLTPNGLSPYRTPNLAGEGEEEDDVFGTNGASNRRRLDSSAIFGPDAVASDFADSSPDPSPSRPHLAPNHPSNEIEVLKQSLAHAQREVNTLRGTVQREKEMRMDYKRKLMELEEKADQYVDEDEEENIDPSKPRPRIAKGRDRSARRGRGSRLAFSRRLAMSPGTPDSELLDDIDETEITPPIPVLVSDTTVEAEFKDQSQAEQTERDSLPVHNRRESAEGMDPAFANVLRSSPTPPHVSSSPLSGMAHGPTRGVRRSRGGVPRHVEERPSSVVEPAGALAAELGMADDILEPEFDFKPETAEFACQTEPVPESPPIIVTPPVVTHEIAIQSDDLTPVPVPVVTNDASVQVSPLYSDASVDALAPIMNEAQIQTPPVVTSEVETQTMLIKPSTVIAPSSVSPKVTRRGTVIPGTVVHASDTDERETTETETETEGEYTDAREYLAAPTPTPTTNSVNDFYSVRAGTFGSTGDMHSVRTGVQDSTTDFYSVGTGLQGSDADDSDQESIKASRFIRNRTSSRPSARHSNDQNQGNMAPPAPPKVMAEEAVQVQEKERDVKEISTQTDDLSAAAPPAFGLFRVGSYTQQFQYIPPSTTSPTSSPGRPSPNVSAESTSTVTQRRPAALTSIPPRGHDRKPSIESAVSGDDSVRIPAVNGQSQPQLSPVDKTRPPTMMLPPPPRMPPPPSLPEKKISTGSSRDMPPPRDIPPPKPTSPPPAELLQRATTPTYGGMALLVPSRTQSAQVRQHGASMPPPQQGLGHRPSTNSFRSAANAATYASLSGTTGISTIEAVRRQRSATSLVSSRRSSMSHQSSVSSEQQHENRPTPTASSKIVPNTPGRSMQGTEGGSTDPVIIHAITQTMIGEFLYKYTRRVVGKGHGEKRHKRFVWVHPYTKTLYWSSADPGSSNVSESSAKSAYIDSVRSILDPNPMPPGLYQYSVVISTPQREMKFTAPTKERHDIWFNALKYLLSRPGNVQMNTLQAGRLPGAQNSGVSHGPMRPPDDTTRKEVFGSPRSARSVVSAFSGDSWNITPRAQRSLSKLSANGSVGKRSGTPAAEYLRLSGPEGAASPNKSDYEYVPGRLDDDQDLDFEIHDHVMGGEGFEGLENVRACCDGRHDLGTLSRHPHHHHHHHHYHHPPHHHNTNAHVQGQHQAQGLEPNEPSSRPVSPSWSYRSRGGSSVSHGESGGGIWSKFGTKRSKGMPQQVPASPSGRLHS